MWPFNLFNKESYFKYKQGGELFALVCGGILVVLLLFGSSNLDLSQYFKQQNPPSQAHVAAQTQPVAQPTAVSFPRGLTVAELQNGHWYEKCDQTTLTCIRARWMAQMEMLQLLDGTYTNPDGYLYPMSFETDLVAGATYSVCDMPGWSTIWFHHEGDQQGTQLTNCMVLTYVGPDEPYRLYTEADGTKIWFDQTSFNAFVYVAPMVK